MTITFSHPKGGVGKSTICLNYLTYLQEQKIEFIALDLDGQHTISNANKIRSIEGMQTFEIETFKNISDMKDFLNASQNKNIVIDSGGFDSAFNRIAISMSDIIITPSSDAPFDIMRLLDFDKMIEDMEKELQKFDATHKINAHLLLNRINPNVKNFSPILEQLSNTKHFKFMNSIIRDRTLYKYSPSSGKSVFESKSKDSSDISAKKEMRAMCEEIESFKQ
ncbi:hypothetical protein BKH41_08775 [Helicobacter sp. 12S02232-10]|uniref:ParA family protein n=1 Tax=Helicobacter sp. 12S02232-10 TaxID=1476197 RepID=UPI000BA518EE|nr:ParA family protein [Helicobacter sp. 12S02232-10]PAF46588.1 hypothetical protein BKH41_08775 [Helicobacter sp. 12S02232-10]